MRIEEVKAHSFGALDESVLSIPPGLCVVYGPNESGKSTWMRAIYCALCGITSGKRSELERSFEEQYRPWNSSDNWKVSAVVVMDDGHKIRVVQDLAKKSGYVTDLSTGKDITARFTSGRKIGMPDLAIACGVDRSFFRYVAIVPQGGVLELLETASGSKKTHPAETIRRFLERDAAVSGAPQGVVDALKRIDEARDRLGQEGREGSKPLNIASRKLKQAREVYDRALQDHLNLVELQETIKRLEEREATLRRRQAYYEAVLIEAEALTLADRATEARELLSSNPGIEVSELKGAVEHSKKLAEAEARLRSVVEELSQYPSRSKDEIQDELATLGDVNFPQDLGIDVEEALAGLKDQASLYRYAKDTAERLDAATSELPKRPDLGKATPEKLAQLVLRASAEPIPVNEGIQRAIEDKERQLARVSTVRTLATAAVAAGVLLLAGAGALLMKNSVAGAIVGLVALGVISAALFWMTSAGKRSLELHKLKMLYGTQLEAAERSKREVGEALLEARTLGLPDTKNGLDSLYEEWRRYEIGLQGQQSIQAQLADARARLGEVASSFAKTLGHLKEKLALEHLEVPTGEPDTFASMSDDSVFAALEQSYQAISQYLGDLSEAADKYRNKLELEKALAVRGRLEEALRYGVEVLESSKKGGFIAGVVINKDELLEDPARLLSFLRSKQETVQKRFETASQARQRLLQVTGGKSLEELDSEAHEAMRRAEKAKEALEAALAETVDSEAKIAASSEKARHRLEEKKAECARELAEVSESLAAERRAFDIRFGKEATGFVSVSEAEELVEQAERELEVLRERAYVLDKTAEFLREAGQRVHTKLAPRLQQVAGRLISKATLGRYEDVFFDDEKPIVRVRRGLGQDDGGPPIDAERLSYGTAEQIYLVFRLVVANEAATKDSIPVVLDEATVHADSERLPELLEILECAAKSEDPFSNISQVVLFTQEDEVLSWARANLAPANVVELAVTS